MLIVKEGKEGFLIYNGIDNVSQLKRFALVGFPNFIFFEPSTDDILGWGREMWSHMLRA